MSYLFKSLTISLFIFCYYSVAQAEFIYLGRSQRGLLMGDAYTAIADDENTLFYNPAALARHSGISFHPINPQLAATNPLKYEDTFSDMPSEPELIADKVLGIPIHLQLRGSPTIKLQHFGLTLFANSSTNVILKNQTHPGIDIDYRLDRGFVMGYAFSFGPAARSKGGKNKSGYQTSFGASVKKMNRQGIKGNFDLFGTELLEIIENSDNYKAIRKNLGFSKGSGWGFDLGMEHTIYGGNTTFNMAASLMDIGHTSFTIEEGTKSIARQEMNLNLGTAFTQDFFLFDYTLAFDLHPLLDPYTPFGSKIHIGARAGIPMLDVLVGWNGGYLSYGISFDIFLFNITAGIYGIETGYSFKDTEAERAVVTLNLLEFSFDP